MSSRKASGSGNLGLDLESTRLTAKALERRIMRDMLFCMVATFLFAGASFFLSLQDALADWLGRPEIKELDAIVIIMIYTVWLVGIFTLRRLYDLRSIIGDREAIEKELSISRTVGAVGRMARGAAHDFNNLMVVIRGTLDLFMMKHDGADSHDEELQPAMQAVDGATRLADQLMRIGRKTDEPMERLDLNEVITDMMKVLKHLADKGQVVFQTVLQPGPCTINANKGQIEQVILNLVTNACETMESGGKLTIETKGAHMCDSTESGRLKIPAGEYIVMTVRDTGPGMEPEVMNHMFEPYFTTKATGAGLGLATLYTIVEQNHGAVDVDSQLGKGTSFGIYWPLAK